MAVGINIVTGFDGKGIKKAIEDFSKLQTSAERTKFAITKMALPAAAALGTLAVASGFAAKAAIEDEAEQAALAQTLRTATGATNVQIAAVEKQVSALTKVSTFSDSQLRPALANLVQATQDVARSQELMTLAMDISAATGKPLINVTDALAKAESGQMQALASLAPVVRENIKEGQGLDATYTQLASLFGGAAAAQTQTAAGQMQMFKNQVGETAEAFGRLLLPVITTLLPVLTALASFAERNRVAFMVLTGVVAALSAAILIAAGYLKVLALHKQLLEIQAYKTATAVLSTKSAVTALGVAAKATGGILAAAAIAQVIFMIGNAASGADRKIAEASANMIINLDKLALASQQDTTDVIGDFVKLAQEIDSKLKFSDVFGDFGREFQLTIGGAKVDIEDFDEAFNKTMEKSPVAAQKLVDALKAQLAITPPNTRAATDLSDAIARYQGQVTQTTAVQAAFNNEVGKTPDLLRKAIAASFEHSAANTTLATEQFKVIELTKRLADQRSKAVVNTKDLTDTQNQLDTALRNIELITGKVTKSTGSSTKEVNKAKQAASDYRSTLQSLLGAKESVRNATQAVADANQKVADATHGVTLAQRDVTLASRDVDKALRDVKLANDAVAKAVQGVAAAQTKTKAARADYANSLVKTKEAQDKLRSATKEVAKAQDAFNAALRGYGKDSKQGVTAGRALAEAQRDSEQSGYSLERAIYKVAEAEAELLELRSDPEATAKNIRLAEIELAEAKLGVAQAEATQTEQQERATLASDTYDQTLNGVKETSDLYKTLLDELNKAREQEQQAVKAVTDARKAEEEALQSINAALEGEREALREVEDARYDLAQAELAVEDAKHKVAEAERGVSAAKRDQAAALRDVAAAQLDEARALYDAAQAQHALNAARAAAPPPAVARIDAQLAGVAALLGTVSAETSNAFAALGLPMLAAGGIVTKPTAAIVGERGAEAVIPLTGSNTPTLGTTVNVTVNAGLGANGTQIGNEIVDVLRKYQRRNGSVPIKVSG